MIGNGMIFSFFIELLQWIPTRLSKNPESHTQVRLIQRSSKDFTFNPASANPFLPYFIFPKTWLLSIYSFYCTSTVRFSAM